MQKEKPLFQVIPNWRRYSRLIPVQSRIDPRYEFVVNQISLPRLAADGVNRCYSRHRRRLPQLPPALSKLPPLSKPPASTGLPEPSMAEWSLVTTQFARV